ncbi:MAG: DUF255 domain-containing protein, partial [Planctomycetes bacterium]|nr:DUF255 domain-containing protein [Planctomycetota bacterium]
MFYRLLGAGPVPWRLWSDAARAEAARRDLPILVFCGAALDHWSAAMAAELIGDAQACAMIDALFVPVMAEPWAEPALAASVQRALALICDSSGWPACALLLPDGRAFGACPFRPLRDRDGQIGLARI